MSQFHNKLKNMLVECHQRGSFKLSSGKTDIEYYDLAPLFLSPTSLRVASFEVVAALSNLGFDALGCLELCPVPLLGAVLARTLQNKCGFVVRKKRKSHGTNKLVEGNLRRGDRCVILEDVTSTGQSVLGTVHIVEEVGGVVVCVLAVINRQEGCDELLKNYDFRWLFTKSELEGKQNAKR